MLYSSVAAGFFHAALTGLAGRRKKSTTGWRRDSSTNTGVSTPPATVTIASGSMGPFPAPQMEILAPGNCTNIIF